MAINKVNKTNNLLSYLDTQFVVAGEMIPDNGEDSYAYAANEAMGTIGIFDGCGGIGSRKYEEYNRKSGAYIASHTVAKVYLDWFNKYSLQHSGIKPEEVQSVCSDIKEVFLEALTSLEESAGKSNVKGSLTKSFPTTASIVMYNMIREGLFASYIWAGDSRGYIMDEGGLHQITEDDIDESEDALSNLSNDAKLTNVVSANGDFTLNYKGVIYSKPCILISSTDGCFGYFSTPMEFEYMLVKTLVKSRSIDDWKGKLNDYIKKYAGDDYTIGIAAFGYRDFKELRRAFENRAVRLYNKYILPLHTASDEQKQAMWEEYKKSYYRGA